MTAPGFVPRHPKDQLDRIADLERRVRNIQQNVAGVTVADGGAQLSNNTPLALGTAGPGSANKASRADHVHAGALATLTDTAIASPASGQALMWSGSAWGNEDIPADATTTRAVGGFVRTSSTPILNAGVPSPTSSTQTTLGTGGGSGAGTGAITKNVTFTAGHAYRLELSMNVAGSVASDSWQFCLWSGATGTGTRIPSASSYGEFVVSEAGFDDVVTCNWTYLPATTLAAATVEVSYARLAGSGTLTIRGLSNSSLVIYDLGTAANIHST